MVENHTNSKTQIFSGSGPLSKKSKWGGGENYGDKAELNSSRSVVVTGGSKTCITILGFYSEANPSLFNGSFPH